ncbi:MAG: apolipoprotein N-acyltransferase, partial [bacterium]
GFLAWVALVPLLWAVLNSPDAKSAANLAGFSGLIFYGISLHWLVRVFGPAAFAFWCIFALWMALHSALLWLSWNRCDLWGEKFKELLWPLSAGIIWCGLEYFRSEVWWLECSWLALGYSQTSAPALFQFCSISGIYGLSAVIVAANSSFVLLFKRRRIPAAITAAMLLLLPLWGKHRIKTFPIRQGKKLSVALVQEETYTLKRLSSLSLEEEAKEADLLVWPEYSFFVPYGREDIYLKLLKKELRGTKSTAVIGSATLPDELKKNKLRNFAWVISKDGDSLGRYDKLHPIPYVEKHLFRKSKSLAPNHSPAPVDSHLGKLGIQICYDLDFEDGTRRMARQNAGILVVPNLDPLEWGKWQHLQHSGMSTARAVESGLWLARAASSGSSQIIDPLGRVIASLPVGYSGVLTGTAYMLKPGTFYSAWGWLFAPACLFFTLLVLVLPSARKFRDSCLPTH